VEFTARAGPQVEALLVSGRVPEEWVPEIRNAFERGAIVNWKMVGVFENMWEAVHPPEKEVLSVGGSSQSRAAAERKRGWEAPPASITTPRAGTWTGSM
jgi:hypothetical protein